MYKPDSLDWRIIALLNKDGRMPSAEIARRLSSVSARTVTNRINALIEHGIINVRAIVNPETVGYGVLADVFVEVEPGQVREVARHAARFPESSYVACATGETDVSISLRLRSIEELFDFVTEKLGKIRGVRRTQTFLLPLKIKDLDTWLPPNVLGASEGNDSENP
ncbi:MAG: Lrp/AsnC family transcriptional regulator [Deltaproteobacteria bacterium]|nr:MAG: Lrp/AsnC family transcriptional regulator [Deltaproteobacteria bacterium]